MQVIEPIDWLRPLRLIGSLLVIGVFGYFLLAVRLDHRRCEQSLPLRLPPGAVIVDHANAGYLAFLRRCAGGPIDCYRLIASDGERVWHCHLGKGLTWSLIEDGVD